MALASPLVGNQMRGCRWYIPASACTLKRRVRANRTPSCRTVKSLSTAVRPWDAQRWLILSNSASRFPGPFFRDAVGRRNHTVHVRVGGTARRSHLPRCRCDTLTCPSLLRFIRDANQSVLAASSLVAAVPSFDERTEDRRLRASSTSKNSARAEAGSWESFVSSGLASLSD